MDNVLTDRQRVWSNIVDNKIHVLYVEFCVSWSVCTGVHAGISSVPLALHNFMCFKTEPMRDIGGDNQLFSDPQSAVNALTWDVPGTKYLELNLGTFLFVSSANLSIVNGPNREFIKWNVPMSTPHESESCNLLRWSAS